MCPECGLPAQTTPTAAPRKSRNVTRAIRTPAGLLLTAFTIVRMVTSNRPVGLELGDVPRVLGVAAICALPVVVTVMLRQRTSDA